MKELRYLFAGILLSVSSPLTAEFTLEELEKQAKKNYRSDDGASYTANALSAFWGDLDFMFECAPPGSSKGESLRLYLVISKEGRISQLTVTPEFQATQCISEAVKDRELPKSPFANYVLGINLTL